MYRKKHQKIRALFSVMLVISMLWANTLWALPQDGTVVGGSSTITQPNATTMQINQATDKSIINWKGYSINTNETVQYNQPNSGSISLNRVVGQDPSLIYGQLSANGQVWVINPNGLLIGNGASINVGSFLGSTLNINDNDFMNGNYKFINTTGSLSSITNQGNINAADGGYVVLISPSITNEGNITTNLGKTYLASGGEVTLNFAGNDLIGFTIDKATAEGVIASGTKQSEAGITNTGKIIANGGQVILSAKVAGDILKTVINNEGIIQAQTIEDISGKIYLLGGMENNAINVGGTLDASAPNGGDGGFIETSAASVKIADDAKITTAASNGKTGTWLIDPNDYTISASGDITGSQLSTNLGSNNITILSSSGATTLGNGDIFVNDAVSWSANNTLTLSAYRNVNVNSNITATGNTAGLVLTPDTCGVACTGTYSLNNGAVITLSGSAPSLTIAGNAYTVINSATALQNMSGNLAGKYALGSNIDATATSGWNAGAGFVPVGNFFPTGFTGAFDGLGHTIAGLTINRPATDFVGLLGYINGATIRNVGLVGGSVRGQNEVGGLAGGMSNLGTITNSYSTANVTGSGYDVGGLVGGSDGIITNSYSTGTVSGSDIGVGGLAGYNWGTITNSYATGSVSGTTNVGGLVGINSAGTISNSYSTGAVSGSDIGVGGLVGYNYATITNSYSTGTVSGTGDVGGLVGGNYATITNSYWDTQTSGWATSSGGTGLTTAQMMQQANFTGLDFINTWWMSGDNTRPFLRMEYSTTITNAHQLQLMGMNATTLAASYTLAANISMAELSQTSGLWSTTTGFVPVGNAATGFTGAFDGLGHTITSLYINRPTTNFVGLFGYTNGMAIRNVGLVGGSVTGNYNVGGLAGRNVGGGTTTNSYSTGTVSGNSTSWYVGGLLGYNNGAISNSYSTGTVSGGVIAVGGLVGMNFAAITNSYATGSVSGTDEVGGLVGDNYGTITNSYSTGTVSGTGDVGGLVGYTNSSAITNSYSTGTVSGSNYVGGLVGENWSGTITNSYSTGAVTGATNVGGLAGYNNSTITNSYWDTQTSGWATSAGGTGLTTAQMKTMANYTGWSISNSGGSSAVWRIYEGNAYPLLRSFLTPLTVTADNASKTYDGAAYSGGNGVTYSIASPTLSGTLTYSGTSQGAINAGSYTITPGGFYSIQQGYDISYVNGALTVNPAALTITADNKSKVYGDANPTLTASYTGLKGIDTSSIVSGLTLNTAATTSSNAGAYTITAADGTAANYIITFANGILTITAAPLLASTSSMPTILDMYPILNTENITDQKIVSAGTPAAELFTAKAVNYTIEQTVFGYQPPEPDDEDKKIERQKREQKIEKGK